MLDMFINIVGLVTLPRQITDFGKI